LRSRFDRDGILFLKIFFISVSLLCTAQLPKVENGKLVLEKQVTFKTGSAELTDEGKEASIPVKEFLVQKDYITTFRVKGHLDNSMAESVTQTLTEKEQWLFVNGLLKMVLTCFFKRQSYWRHANKWRRCCGW